MRSDEIKIADTKLYAPFAGIMSRPTVAEEARGDADEARLPADGYPSEGLLDRLRGSPLFKISRPELQIVSGCALGLIPKRSLLLPLLSAHLAQPIMERAMKDALEYMQRRAREFARSGKFVGWRSVVFQLQFEPGLEEAFWHHSASGEDAFEW